MFVVSFTACASGTMVHTHAKETPYLFAVHKGVKTYSKWEKVSKGHGPMEKHGGHHLTFGLQHWLHPHWLKVLVKICKNIAIMQRKTPQVVHIVFSLWLWLLDQ